MANTEFINAQSGTEFRKSTGEGTDLDPKIFDAHIDKADGTRIDPATEQKQDVLIGHVDGIETLLGTIDADTGALVTAIANLATQTTLAALLTELQAKADLTETQPVSAASLPLPTGAATAANQTAGNTSLSTLAGAVAGSEVQVDVVASPGLTDAQLRATAVAVAPSARTLGTYTDRSASTSATPGTWTVLAASSTTRTRLFLRVPLAAAAPVTIGRGGTGAEVVYDEIQPGGAFLMQSSDLAPDTSAFSVRSTAASVAFIAHEYAV